MTGIRLPRFTVVDSAPEGGWRGRWERADWVGERWIGYLQETEGRFVKGKFHEVDADAQTAVFRPANPANGLLFRPGGSYPYLEGYWGERAALVMDRSRKWRRSPSRRPTR